jgi:hypothetical protein
MDQSLSQIKPFLTISAIYLANRGRKYLYKRLKRLADHSIRSFAPDIASFIIISRRFVSVRSTVNEAAL